LLISFKQNLYEKIINSQWRIIYQRIKFELSKVQWYNYIRNIKLVNKLKEKRQLIMSVIVKHWFIIIETMDFCYFKIVIGFFSNLKIFKKDLCNTHAHASWVIYTTKSKQLHECLLTKHARNEVMHWKT